MSRRNRTNRRRSYGKRQHEIRERRPSGAPDADWSRHTDDWIAPELIDDAGQRDAMYDGYDAEGWIR